jgi:hypothetical protein
MIFFQVWMSADEMPNAHGADFKASTQQLPN